MNVFEHYLEGAEREAYIEEFTYDNNMARLQTLYEMTNLQLSQMYRDAELKVLTECGTYDDFQYLIEEADKEAGKNKMGILESIINAIGELLKKIGDKITNLFNKKDSVPDNATIKIPKEVFDAANQVEQISNKISNGITALTKGDPVTALNEVSGIKIPELPKIAIGAAAVAGTAAAGGIAYKTMPKDAVFKMIDKLKGIRDKISGMWDTVKNGFGKLFNKNNQNGENDNNPEAKKQDDTNKASSKINEFTKFINGLIDHFNAGIDNVIGKGKDENKEGNGEDPNKDGSNSDSGNQMTIGDYTFYIDTETGEVTRKKKDSTDEPVAVTQNEMPQKVLDASNAIKNKAKSGNNQGDGKTEQSEQTGDQNGQKNDNNNQATNGADNNAQKDDQNNQNGNTQTDNNANTNGQQQNQQPAQQNQSNQKPKNKVFSGNNGKVILTPGSTTIYINAGGKKKKFNNIANAKKSIYQLGLKDQYNNIVNTYNQISKSTTTESAYISEFIDMMTESGCEVVNTGMTISIIPSFEMECAGYLIENGYDAYIKDGKIVVNESVDTSRQTSIFGVDYSSEYTESTNSAFDEELDELSKMFAEL